MTVPIAGRGPQVLAVFGLFTALTTLTLALRIYCRAIISKHRAVGWDDGLAFVAWAFFICHTAFSMTGVYHGTGQHAWNIKPATEIPIALKFWWLCEIVYVISNMAIKGSIAVMLLRLAVEPAQRVIIWTTLVITELFSAGFMFFFLFQCWPSEYFYTRYTGGKGSCVDPESTIALVYAYSAVICIGDWIYAILPCVLVWNLQMPRTQKFFVGLVLAMGAIASAATIARIPYIHNMTNQADFLYVTTDVAIWSCSETGLAITAACCVTLRPLFRSWFATSAFNKSGTTATVGTGGYRTASSGRDLSKVYQGKPSGYSVQIQGKSEQEALQDMPDDMELTNITKGGILVEQCDSASVESAAPSSSSTANIVRRSND